MLLVRRAAERGHASHGWLDSWHTFSFGDYWDEAWQGFGALRVINDDTVVPGAGFPPHSHRDMEILSYVLHGQLQHRDSLGNGSIIRPGEVQRMRAGRGIQHSEFNPSESEKLHFLQIWLVPGEAGLTPGYAQRELATEEKSGRLTLVAGQGGRDGALELALDASVYVALLDAGQRVTHPLAAGRRAWIHVAQGSAIVNGLELQAGDGVGVADEPGLEIGSPDWGEVLLFDLA